MTRLLLVLLTLGPAGVVIFVRVRCLWCAWRGHDFKPGTIWQRMLQSGEYRLCRRCKADWWTVYGR